MAKPVFPRTNLCGQLFNDFINGEPILKIYASKDKGRVTWHDEYTIEIEPLQSKDVIHLTHRNGQIRCIEYETTSKELVDEVYTFLDTHFEKEPPFGNIQLDIYDIHHADMFISVMRRSTTHYIGIRIM